MAYYIIQLHWISTAKKNIFVQFETMDFYSFQII